MGWNIKVPEAEYFELPGDARRLEALVKELKDVGKGALDTETDGLDLVRCIPYYWSTSWTGKDGKDHRATLHESTFRAIKDVDSYDFEWILANAKFDAHMLANIGIELSGKLVDVQVMHALLYEEMPHDLKQIAQQILGWKWTDFQDTFGSLRKGRCACGHTETGHLKLPDGRRGYCKKCTCSHFRQVNALDLLNRCREENMGLLIDYAANDAYGTWHVYWALRKALEDEVTWSKYPELYDTLWDLFYKTEVPFTKVLYWCERNGLRVDKAEIERLIPKIEKDLTDKEKFITHEVGKVINPGSDDQLRKVLIDEMGFKPVGMTKGGKTGNKLPSVDAKFFEHYEGHPLIDAISEWKKVSKLLGTYIKKMPGRLDHNNRVHMRLNQDVARTGRLSSSSPNMQNVPTGEKDRFNLRNMFIPDPGDDMVVADYSQLEMRLLACAAMEPKMIDIFLRNWDIHCGNAAMVFELPYDDIINAKKIDKQVKQGKLPPSAMTEYVLECLKARSDVKTIGFGLNYGMKEWSLAKRMGSSVDEAVAKIEQYMEAYPAVRMFFESSIEEAREYGHAYTLLGRRRYLPNLYADRDEDRWRAERQASNMPIQGTAQDVCKMAMINIFNDSYLRDRLEYRMCLQVHDEIVGECPKEAVEEVMPIIKDWMEHPFPTELAVPMEAEPLSGQSWGNAK
jgi:DNA polymerase I-like protein with 3'-5' exonuclease and polymerase domains